MSDIEICGIDNRRIVALKPFAPPPPASLGFLKHAQLTRPTEVTYKEVEQVHYHSITPSSMWELQREFDRLMQSFAYDEPWGAIA